MVNTKFRVVRRGIDPKDYRWFSCASVLKLKKAQHEMEWLLNRGYNSHSVVEMIGNHYQFSLRQRNALKRSTSAKAQADKRKSKCILPDSLGNNCLYIDGFNLIITLEAALSGAPVILCNDGTFRDLAGLRGTYSIVDKTYYALGIMGKEFCDLNILKVKIFLDRGVSNSGRLKKFILEFSSGWSCSTYVELMDNVDSFLYDKEVVVTSDSVILDRCSRWYNLAGGIIEDYITDSHIIDLSGTINE